VAGVTVRSLALERLTVSRTIRSTQLRAQGLRVGLRVPAGTRMLRFAIYRVAKGRPADTAVVVGYRLVSRAGTFGLVLKDRALVRKLKPGRYEVRVQAGHTRSDLGVPSTAVFTVAA
jgi:hypothetical protein